MTIKSILYLTLGIVTLTACNNDSTEDAQNENPSALIEHKWILLEEHQGNEKIDCRESEIKTILDLKKNNYFILYDDISDVRIEPIIKGQYLHQDNSLTLKYENDGQDVERVYTIDELSDSSLVLENANQKRILKYKKL